MPFDGLRAVCGVCRARRSPKTDTTGASNMHMLMVIAGGTVLLGVFLLFGKLWGGRHGCAGAGCQGLHPGVARVC